MVSTSTLCDGVVEISSSCSCIQALLEEETLRRKATVRFRQGTVDEEDDKKIVNFNV